MRNVAITTAFVALTTCAVAQPVRFQLDHLVPEPSEAMGMIRAPFSFKSAQPFTNHFPFAARIFATQIFGWNAPIAIALLPSSSGDYELLGSEVADRSYRPQSSAEQMPALHDCKAHVSNSTAKAIISVWDKVVLQTHDDGGELPLYPDGEISVYSIHLGSRIVTGWSGSGEGPPKHLSSIAFRLYQFCSAEEGKKPHLWLSVKDDVAALK